jgi:hypothetical protein
LVAVGVVLSVFDISAQPAGKSGRVVVQVAGDEIPVRIDGRNIRVTDALSKDNTPLTLALDKCAGDPAKDNNVPSTSGKLSSSILVLQIDGLGTRCVPESETRSFDSIHVQAHTLFKTIQDSTKKSLSHGDGAAIDFKEIEVWTQPTGWDIAQYWLANLSVGLGLAVLGTVVFEVWRSRGSSSRSSTTPVA